MIDENSSSHPGTGMNFYSCKEPAYVREYPPQQIKLVCPQPVAQAMKPERVKSRIA
jgi:hypothetical protein